MRKRYRILSVLAATGLLFGNAAPVYADALTAANGAVYYEPEGDTTVSANGTAEEEAERIEIRTEADLVTLAQQCHIDSFSAGKEVVLMGDIRLSGGGFTTIPIFCGSFNGNGHTISGYNYDGDGYVTGFFRYIGNGAVIKNLNISGTIHAEGKQQVTGGLCGINAGRIAGCSFDGRIYGKSETGGIAGVNTSDGEIQNSVNKATLSGYYFTGGICGKNYGMIYGCGNTGNLNDSVEWITEEDEMNTDLLEDLTENSGDTQNLRRQSGIDTGGIAGYSKGALIGCTNDGVIGYEHAGYNIGGIAGRQTGLVSNCTNRGVVLGRKDIGGVVGQMEPYLELNEEDSIHKDVNDLHDMVDQLTRIMDSDNAVVRSDLDALQGYADSAVDTGDVMADQASGYVNQNADVVNEGSARLSHVLDMMPGVTDNVTAAGDSADALAADMKQLNEHLYVSGNISEEQRDRLNGYSDTIANSSKEMEDAAGRIIGTAAEKTEELQQQDGEEQSLPLDPEQTPDIDAIKEALEGSDMTDIDAIKEEIESSEATDAAGDAGRAAADAAEAMSGLYKEYTQILESASENAHKDIEDGLKEIENTMDALDKAQASVNDITSYLNAQDDLQMVRVSEEWDKNVDNIHEQMDNMSAAMQRLGDHAQDYGEDVNRQIRQINDQINLIYNDIYDKVNERIDGIREDNHDYIYADISDADLEHATLGKTTGCMNYGVVRGDVNIGGITGAMAIDEEDPEGNAAGSVQLSIGGRYTSRNIVLNCTNRGYVTARNDGVGGIAGFMKNGVISASCAYGPVESAEGSYVGGIAGQSLAIIRDCYVLCALSGQDNVGGIAGCGATITGCYAMPTITDCTGRGGAIAGQIAVDEDTQSLRLDQLSDNHYVSEVFYGIDQISYRDAAEPMEYAELLEAPGTPIAFRYLTVTFRAEDQFLGTQRVNYGDPYSTITYPEIPAKEGYYGVWPEAGEGNIMGNLVITAGYTDSVRVIESATLDPASGKQLAMIDNDFNNEARLVVETPDAPEFAEGGYAARTIYSVRVEDSGKDEGDVLALRLYNPYGKQKVSVWQYNGSGWSEVEYLERGSYLQVSMQGTEGIYCIAQHENNLPLIICGAGAAAVLLVIVILHRSRRRKKKKA